MEPIVLAVTVNTEPKGEFFLSRTADGDFLVKVSDLVAAGFAAPAGPIMMLEGEPHVSLRSIGGVTFDFDQKTLTLRIMADPALLPSNTVDLAARRRAPPADLSQPSGFFNYSLSYGAAGPEARADADFAGELGLRMGDFLALGNGNTIRTPDGQKKFVRLMSNVSRDDRNTLRHFVAGDFFATSRDLGNGAIIGGVGISKLYDLDPYLNPNPVHNINGVATLPSDLEVYVDGQKIRSERVQPGPFELRDVAGYGGARSVQVLLRDAFGRVQQLEFPLYFSSEPLRPGLHDYSYAFGAMRRGYGAVSNNYGPPALVMYHRYGLTNAVTLGVRGEGRRGLYNAGPTATFVLGRAGVLNVAVAASSIDGTRGYSALVGYDYQSRNWSVSASLRRDSRRYIALSDPAVISGRKFDGSLSVGYSFDTFGSISISRSVSFGHSNQVPSAASAAQAYSVAVFDSRSDTSLSYTVPLLAGRATLAASLGHVKDSQGTRNELFVNLNFNIDSERRLASTYQRNSQSQTESVQLDRAQPLGEGLGYDLSASHTRGPAGDSLKLRLSTQYNAPAAIFRADLGRQHGVGTTPSEEGSYRYTVAGGLAVIGRNLAIGRPITDSFGLVRTGSLGGVPVTVNGQPVGVTDGRGQLLITSLSSYHDNQVALLPQNMPIDYAFAATSKRVAPPARGGVLLDFPVTKMQGVLGKLKVDHDGSITRPDQGEVSLAGNGRMVLLPVGRGGEFYVENLLPGRYPATAAVDQTTCSFELVIPVSNEPFIDVGDVICKASP
ncbi:fimbria/pilus outer membrane usher protein [Caenimonas terrae]|uniref:Fimbria/pilus outer membrane usher protein n=1 Tax=Caenimonas terrae TaxID=696074 RepID=A0ABW0NAK7_9BURK